MSFRIVHGPLEPPQLANRQAGGFVTFEGRVRDHNEGRDVVGIEYEAFEEMAVSEGDAILSEALRRFGVLEAEAVHRVGPLMVGDMAVWVGTAAAHRKEAFLATEFIIDEIKHRLPIWKRERYVDGDSEWVQCTHGPNVSEADLYARQVRLHAVGAAGQERLRRSRVLVVGAGGLGSAALPYLAAAGVGHIEICEPDLLDVANLHRQVIYRAADVGRPKGELAAEALRRLNPFVEVVVHSVALGPANASALVGGVDMVLDCTDSFRIKFLLNDACVAAGVPLVQAAIYQFEGQVQVIDPAGGGGCLRCLWPETPPEACVGSCAEVGVLGVTPGLFGTLQAAEAIKRILGVGEPLTESVLLMDLLTYEVQRLQRPRDPGCPCCGTGTMVVASPLEVFADEDLSAYQAIDIREADERTPLPAVGAGPWIQCPMSAFSSAMADLRPDGLYLLVCSRGVRSARLAAELRDKGYRGVVSLAGGAGALRRLA